MILLHLDSSARLSRSLSRRLSRVFLDSWLAARPADRVIRRDLAIDPPPHVSEPWIAAAFTPAQRRTAAMTAALAWSDRALAEVEAADLIVMGVPMYNYGMPSALKAWFDQVIRVGRAFSFDLGRGDRPIEPILAGKTLAVLSARGEFGFGPGEARAQDNHLDPHLSTCARLIGVEAGSMHSVAIEYQEFGDERHARSIVEAERAAVALAARLASQAALDSDGGRQPAS